MMNNHNLKLVIGVAVAVLFFVATLTIAEQPSEECNDERNGEFRADPSDNKTYYECMFGQWYNMSCMGPYVFSEQRQGCALQRNVEMDKKCQNKDNGTYSADEKREMPPGSGMKVAVYYQCRDGEANVMYCAPGQKFDQQSERCVNDGSNNNNGTNSTAMNDVNLMNSGNSGMSDISDMMDNGNNIMDNMSNMADNFSNGFGMNNNN